MKIFWSHTKSSPCVEHLFSYIKSITASLTTLLKQGSTSSIKVVSLLEMQ